MALRVYFDYASPRAYFGYALTQLLLLEFDQVLVYSHLASSESPGIIGQHQQPHWLVLRRSRYEPFSITSYGERFYPKKCLCPKIRLNLTCRRTATVLTACYQHDLSFKDLATGFLLGGVSGEVSKTLTAPIERVRLVFQTQNAIPKIRNGQVPSYTGIGNCFSRIYSEQGAAAFWRVNFTNCIRLFFSDASLQFVLQGFGQVNFPEVRPEAGSRHVLLL